MVPVDGRPAGRHGSGGEQCLLDGVEDVRFVSIWSRIAAWLNMKIDTELVVR